MHPRLRSICFALIAAALVLSCVESDPPVLATRGGGDRAIADPTPVCSGGSRICVGRELQTCALDGRSYVPLVTCPTDAQCQRGISTGKCPPTLCTPGESFCSADAPQVLRCSEDGNTLVTVQTCAEPTPVCDGSKCVECWDQNARCAGTTPQLCVGDKWQTTGSCSGEVADTCMGSRCNDARLARWAMPRKNFRAPWYRILSPNIVRDEVTGLEWQRNVSTSDVNASTSEYRTHCETISIDGEPGWRTPTPVELLSIVDYDRAAAPFIDTSVFTDTPANGFVARWTGTSFPRVDTSTGLLSLEPIAGTAHRVRCVRTSPSRRVFLASQRFATAGNEVTDDYARMYWLTQDVVGTHAEATAACKDLSMYLPTVKELYTLVDPTVAAAPYIDQTTFAGTAAEVYWTETNDPLGAGALTVDFGTPHGAIAVHDKNEVHRARCAFPKVP